MGIGKWWLKHGPGSPGSIAKAMGIAFRVLHSQNPDFSLEDLLRVILKSRYMTLVGQEEQDAIIRKARGSLIRLTLLVVERERWKDLMGAPGEIYSMAFDAVLEVLRVQAPEQIDREVRENGIDEFRRFWDHYLPVQWTRRLRHM